MPNIKSQKDRVIQSAKETLRNKAVKSNLKTVIKKTDSALAAGSADAGKAVITAVATIDKACSKGVLHKNTAARKVSKVMRHENATK
ncbi:MAG: 30S ribosomal protein S20 [Oscillospiraceae bacterium]